jgi:hypothetical protein
MHPPTEIHISRIITAILANAYPKEEKLLAGKIKIV